MISGLMCTHPNCFALFLNLDDSETHAFDAHAGKVMAVTCAISEHHLENGDIELLRVLDEIGERLENFDMTENSSWLRQTKVETNLERIHPQRPSPTNWVQILGK
jgi:hypothetical protein